MRDYGKAIKLLRKRSDLTQAQLADKLNVTYQTVSKWENNVNMPDISVMETLCEVFSISLDDFLHVADGDNEAALDQSAEQNDEAIAVGESSSAVTCSAEQQAECCAATDTASLSKFSIKPWIIVVIAIAVIAIILTAVLVPVLLLRDGDKARRVKLTAAEVYAKVNPSVFSIEVNTQSGTYAGSGFFTDRSGNAVTNYHVIRGAHSIKVMLSDGNIYDVDKILGYDVDHDVALIHVGVPKPVPVKFSTTAVKTGDTVYAIGYPESFVLGTQDSTFTNGIVSKPSYNIEGVSYIQSTVDITHGNSGGALVNEYGEVVGMTTASIDLGNINYMNMSVPASTIQRVRPSIKLSVSEYAAQYGEEYTVKYYVGETLYRDVRISAAESVKNITPDIEDCEFFGWYDDKEFTVAHDFSARPSSDITLYAKCKFRNRTVVFDGGNGAIGTVSDIAADSTGKATLPTNGFKRAGYAFSGWECDGATYAVGDIIIVGEQYQTLTVRAIWTPVSYTVKYIYDDVTVTETHVYGESYKIPVTSLERTGYTLSGWTYAGKIYGLSDSVKNLSAVGDSTVEMTPTWEPIKYTMTVGFGNLDVKFDGKIYFGGSSTEIECTYGEDPFEGHELYGFYINFVGWDYYDADGEPYIGDPRYINPDPDKSVSAVANWMSGTYNVYVYMHEYEYTATLIPFFQLSGMETYTMPSIVDLVGSEYKDGYKFVGWVHRYSEPTVYYEDGATLSNLMINGYVDGANIVMGTKAYVELHGNWQPVEITVNFDGGTASGTMSSVTFKYNEDAVLPLNSFIKDGYSFVGWECDGVVYGNGENIKNRFDVDRELTFTARWIKNFTGDGTEQSPYVIDSYDTLASVYDFVRYMDGGECAHYMLANDIDCDGNVLYPIGVGKSFKGVFDGNNHVIRNACFAPMPGTRGNMLGLFGYVFDGQILNLGIEDYDYVRGDNDVVYGYIAAPLACSYVSTHDIECCYAIAARDISLCDMSVTMFGGLVGNLYGAAVNCYSVCSVDLDINVKRTYMEMMYIGGLAAVVNKANSIHDTNATSGTAIAVVGQLKNCFAELNITIDCSLSNPRVRLYCGLLSADNNGCLIENCFTMGEIYYAFSKESNSSMAVYFSSLYNFAALITTNCKNCTGIYTCGNIAFTDLDEYKGVEMTGQAYESRENLCSVAWLSQNLNFDSDIWKDGEAHPELVFD